MYINFWYPVCLADDLTNDAPLRAEILGLRFVAFRDTDDEPHVLADTCVHRGGSLGKGKVAGDRVACPYHGWQFGGDGVCRHIPVLGEDGKIPGRAKVDSYPVIEAYGIVFAFLGDLPEEERPPLLDIAEWDQPGWRATGPVTFEVNAYFDRRAAAESRQDQAHASPHRRSAGCVRRDDVPSRRQHAYNRDQSVVREHIRTVLLRTADRRESHPHLLHQHA
jgi:phenylpropionate dioxygenase-like ring-hydroxylating dioxygenase large terminal subunit